MKTRFLTSGIVALGILTLAISCSKKDETAQPAETVNKTAEVLGSEATKAAEAVKTTVKEVTETATAQAGAAQEQAQGIIDKAKALVSEQKYQDALSNLGQLTSTKLTPDQQKLVDSLKAQIQTALAKAAGTGSNAASALGGVLGGKK